MSPIFYPDDYARTTLQIFLVGQSGLLSIALILVVCTRLTPLPVFGAGLLPQHDQGVPGRARIDLPKPQSAG